jgi:hypothetical protein
VTVMDIPLRITDTRTKPNLQKLLFGLFCQVRSTRTGAAPQIKQPASNNNLARLSRHFTISIL